MSAAPPARSTKTVHRASANVDKHNGLSSGTNQPSAHLPAVAAAHASRAAQPSPGDASLPPAPSFGSALVGGVTAGALADPVAGIDPPAVSPSFLDDVTLADDAADHHYAANYQPQLYDTLLWSEMLGEDVDPKARAAGLAPTAGGAFLVIDR